MAFDRSNFNPGSRGGKGPKLAAYDAGADDPSTVEADGYFDDVSTELETGDLLFVDYTEPSADTAKVYRVTKTTGDIALSAGSSIGG